MMIHLRSTRRICNLLKESTGFSPFEDLQRACSRTISLTDAFPALSSVMATRCMASKAYTYDCTLDGDHHKRAGLCLASSLQLREVRSRHSSQSILLEKHLSQTFLIRASVFMQILSTRLLSTAPDRGAPGLPLSEKEQSDKRTLLERILPKHMLPYVDLMRLHSPIGTISSADFDCLLPLLVMHMHALHFLIHQFTCIFFVYLGILMEAC